MSLIGKLIELTGKRFGRLTVLERAKHNDNGNKPLWKCKCDCGKIVVVRGQDLRSGKTRSCGCYHNESATKRATKHGASKDKFRSRLYHIWIGMRQRCSNPDSQSWRWYKNINVCDEWNDYKEFEKWALSHGYDDGLSIDRIDSSGDYCPENCRWATAKTQANNVSSNHIVEYKGKRYTLMELSELTGIDYSTLGARIRAGWDVKVATETEWDARTTRHTFQGRTLSLDEWAKEVGMNSATLRSRINNFGWSFEHALLTPVKKKGTRT